MATGLVGRFTACGLLILGAAAATAGCTQGQGGAAGTPRPVTPAHASASTATPSARPTPTPVAGPARPVGQARLGPEDGALARWIQTVSLAEGQPRPARDDVVVIRRGSGGAAEVGWLSGRGYCLGYRHVDGGSSLTCGPFSVAADPKVPEMGRAAGMTDRMVSENERPQRYYTLAVVVGDSGPFRLTGDDHRGFLYQSRATLAPNRPVTFLEWGYLGPSLPLDAKVCSASTPRCLTDHDT